MEAAALGSIFMEAAPYIGMGTEAFSSIYSGARERDNSKFEARMLQQKGNDELAIAQREAMKSRKEGDLAASRALAVAAGSGAGAADETVLNTIADIEVKKRTNVLTDMYRGMTARNDLYAQAKIRKKEGRDAQTAGLLNAASSIYGGVSRIARDRRRQEYEEDY